MNKIYNRIIKKIRDRVITECCNIIKDEYQRRAFIARVDTNPYEQGQLSGLRIALKSLEEKKGE